MQVSRLPEHALRECEPPQPPVPFRTASPHLRPLTLGCHEQPLQVPSSYENPAIANVHARLEDAMANALDEGIGNVTNLLKSRGMWNDTVLFFSADNGGPVHDPAGGCVGQSSSNNYPLRG